MSDYSKLQEVLVANILLLFNNKDNSFHLANNGLEWVNRGVGDTLER